MPKLSEGTNISNATYTVTSAGAFDDRLVVRTRADLINPMTWDVDGVPMVYSGMIVAVVRDVNDNFNGAWLLQNALYYNKYKYLVQGDNVSLQHNQGWRKIESEGLPNIYTDQFSILGNGSQNDPLNVHIVDGGSY
jgi:hypothetical protein